MTKEIIITILMVFFHHGRLIKTITSNLQNTPSSKTLNNFPLQNIVTLLA
jgi:hypothetical protein